jgi:vacuolar protein sorting-associated protein 45
VVYATSDILQKEVFLFERIDMARKASLKFLTAIYFLRPIEENIQLLIRELHEPRCGNYYICMFFNS